MLGKKSIYVGQSKKELEMVKKALEKNNIRYSQNEINHNSAFLGPGHGCGRSVSGIDSHNDIYEILVKRNEYERAKACVKKYKENN
jgi:hypothetical protein